MRARALFGIFLLTLSCSKRTDPTLPPEPPMEYISLGDSSVTYGHGVSLDLDADGRYDFHFSVTLVGDPISRVDKYRFAFNSRAGSFLYTDKDGASPVLNPGEVIPSEPPGPLSWYEYAESQLTERVLDMQGTENWGGPWANASHQYLAIGIKKAGTFLTGWLEISTDQSQSAILLHRAALARIPLVAIKAGY